MDSGSSRAPLHSIAGCGCITFAMASGSAAGSPICPIRTAAARASRCPRTRFERYTWRSYEIVSRRFQESVLLGFLLAVGGTVTAAFFLRQSGRSATEDQHIRGATLAPSEVVVALAKASKLPYDFTLAGVPLFREAETDHVLVCGAPGSGKGVAIKELLDQIRARGRSRDPLRPERGIRAGVLPARQGRSAQSPGCPEPGLDALGRGARGLRLREPGRFDHPREREGERSVLAGRAQGAVRGGGAASSPSAGRRPTPPSAT